MSSHDALSANEPDLAKLQASVRDFLRADRAEFGWEPAVDSPRTASSLAVAPRAEVSSWAATSKVMRSRRRAAGPRYRKSGFNENS